MVPSFFLVLNPVSFERVK